MPGLTFDGIAPGATFTTASRVNQSGTYWYHSHSRFQEQIGLYGPIVDRRARRRASRAEREHVVLLSDWTDDDPEAHLRDAQTAERLLQLRQAHGGGFPARRARSRRAATAGRPAHVGRDAHESDRSRRRRRLRLHLSHERRDAGGATGRACSCRGERVRLRFINGSSMSFFDVRIPGLEDDRRRGGRAGRRAGHGRRIPHRRPRKSTT